MAVYIETFKGTVAPADCDHLGHMNVQHYFRAIGDGVFCVMAYFGLTREEVNRRKIAFAGVQAKTEFLREVKAGDVIVLESTLLKFGQKSATFHHRLKNVGTDEVAMVTELKCALLDLDNRKATEIPEDIKIAASKFFPST